MPRVRLPEGELVIRTSVLTNIHGSGGQAADEPHVVFDTMKADDRLTRVNVLQRSRAV